MPLRQTIANYLDSLVIPFCQEVAQILSGDPYRFTGEPKPRSNK